jgi:hypothetical protein
MSKRRPTQTSRERRKKRIREARRAREKQAEMVELAIQRMQEPREHVNGSITSGWIEIAGRPVATQSLTYWPERETV